LPQNFPLADCRSCLLAFAILSLFFFVPGYVAAWLVDLVGFRRRLLLTRIAIAIPLSIGLSPVLSYLAGRALPSGGIWFVFGLLWIALPATCLADIRARGTCFSLTPRFWRYASIGAAWLAIGLLSLIDLQRGDRLYFSVVAMDYSVRSAMVAAISRTGIPPLNPFFFPGHSVPLRYHYFWLIPCSLADQLGGSAVSARQAFIGGTLWCGLGMMAIVAAFLRFVHPAGSGRIYRRSVAGIALLCVTGLDILPNLLLDSWNAPQADPEWWNEQVSSWFTSVLWVPHHTAALIAALVAVLIIWNSALARETWRRVGWALLASLCLASCLGSSVYVALVVGAALCLWTSILVLKHAWREALFATGAGLIALLAVAPHLFALRGPAAAATASAAALPIHFAVRPFLPSWGFHAWSQGSAYRENLLNTLLLPLNYFFELGAFLVAGIWTVRRWLRDPARFNRYQVCTVVLAGTSVLICTFLRSSVIANNDLGWRGFLLGQFVLLIWAVDMLEHASGRARLLLGVLMAVGVASSIYEAATVRLYPIAFDKLALPGGAWLSPDHHLGKRTYALRMGYEELKTKLPPDAIVQHNPAADSDDFPYGLYADRPVADENSSCGTIFGGDSAACAPLASAITPIFAGSGAEADLDRACAEFSMAAVLVKDTDPVWRDRASWVWRRQPIVANPFMRALPCGTGAGQSLGGY